ncbi:matrixin [Tahibacter aquaticus]|uniref:Matrixin n=1 Tax=Tahibacter aquaticus TaxID=520092 RepID=A0A4R6YU46_9GAMM|nr:matrixin family metalloprotease [Tahibacter aquaticus]TDR42054.1 matrixin [Tahibacter aquaticus]
MYRNLIAAALVAAGISAFALPAMAAQLVPSSLQELASAPRIVVAEVEKAQSRWNPQGTLIVTDYTLRRVEALRGDFDARFVLTQGGGTVGEETHQLSDLPVLRAGARYLLILNREDNPVFSSVRYGAAGAREVEASTGRLLGGGDLSVFRDAVKKAAVIDDDMLRGRSREAYPAAQYRRDIKPASSLSQRPLENQDVVLPPGRQDESTFVSTRFADAPLPFLPEYVVQHAPAPFITFNNFPSSWVWSPVDQQMMAEWNRYGDIFRVSVNPTGTWAWTNNVYDLAGFPGNADMQAQFGAPWGATTLAICFSRWFGSGPIVESDIAANPAFQWTLDDAFGTENASAAWAFRQTIEHELGHSWGLQHPWETQNVFWPSTMNYGPKWARNPRIHSDDTAGIRSVYPGIAIHDATLSMYTTADDPLANDAAYTASVPAAPSFQHGQNLSLATPVTLENLGTTTIVNPAVDLYLVQNRFTYTAAVNLGRANFVTTVGTYPNSIRALNLGSFAVANTVPTGVYFTAIALASSGGVDVVPGNDSAWGTLENPVAITNLPVMLTPTTSAQNSSVGRIGPGGVWTFRFNAQIGKTYRFSTCGLAAFDTVTTVQGTHTLIGDDECGQQSRIAWTAPSNQLVTVVVSGFDRNQQGNFQLEHRIDPNLIFNGAFE